MKKIHVTITNENHDTSQIMYVSGDELGYKLTREQMSIVCNLCPHQALACMASCYVRDNRTGAVIDFDSKKGIITIPDNVLVDCGSLTIQQSLKSGYGYLTAIQHALSQFSLKSEKMRFLEKYLRVKEQKQ